MPRHNHPKHSDFQIGFDEDNEPTYAIDYVVPKGKELRIKREKSRKKINNSHYGDNYEYDRRK